MGTNTGVYMGALETTTPFQPQNSKDISAHTYTTPKKVCDATEQDSIVPDDSARVNDDQTKLIQQVIRVCLHYGWAVDNTILPALSTIASE